MTELSRSRLEMPVVPVTTSTFVEANVVALQSVIGRYPPRFASEEHRDQVYARWSRALIAARQSGYQRRSARIQDVSTQ